MTDFKAYLQSLVATYEQWWKLYALTDAVGQIREPEEEQLSPFDFGLTVQAVSKEREHTSSGSGSSQVKREKTERLPVLKGIRKYADDHVLLIGRPGSGKSTALIRLLLEMATQALEQGTGKIPILIELRYWQNSAIERIQAFLYKHDPSLSLDESTLSSLLCQGRFLLLLDGLNELSSEVAKTQLASFRQDYSKVPMIFTTRNLRMGGDLGIEKKLEMQPLSEGQMKEFIRAYVRDQAEAMLQQLNDRLWEFGQTPLLLWMLCEVFQQSPEHRMPSNLAGIFQRFTTMYEGSSVRKHKVALLKGDVRPLSDRRIWKPALQAIASIMMQGETAVDFRVAIHRDEAEQELSRIFPNEQFPVRDILDDLLKYHLLQNRSTDQIEFRHQLIQEYYVAEHLWQLLPDLSDEQLKRDYLNLLKWTESISLMLALVPNEGQALRVVKLALDVDLRLGARLAGEVRIAFQEATLGEVSALPVADWLKVELLGHTQSKVAIPELVSFLSHTDINIAKVSASYIEKTDNQTAVDALRQRLEEFSTDFFSRQSWGYPDEDAILWTAHVEALAYLAPQEAIQFLRERLSLNRPMLLMITDAVSILMRLDAENLIPELLRDLYDSQKKEINKIVADSSSEENKRQQLLIFLGRSSDYDLFISDLIELLEKETHESVQKQIIQLLGQSKHELAIPTLVQILKGGSDKLRVEATKQLVKLSATPNLIDSEELRIFAGCEDIDISWYASVVLGHLGDSTALHRMLYELKNNSIPGIRSTAAHILGIIGDPDCVPSLLKTMEDDSDRYVRINAACALSCFDKVEATPALLDTLKSITNAHPHTEIIKSMSRLGLQDALVEVVKSKRIAWQRAAVELGNLATSQEKYEPVVLQYLFDALVELGHDATNTNETIELLPKLLDSSTLDRLVDALENPEKHTKDIYFSNRVAFVLVRCPPTMMAEKLPTLIDLNRRSEISQLSWLVPVIQNNCKFYSYKIWRNSIQDETEVIASTQNKIEIKSMSYLTAMFSCFNKNKKWVFSGIGVFALGLLLTPLLNENASQPQNPQKQSQSGSGNIQAGGDVTIINEQLSQQEISDNFPLRSHPMIDLSKPIEGQLQLFGTDKVRIYSPSDLQEVWLGSEWQEYVAGKEYMVTGVPGEPVTPKFKGTGGFKLEVIYTADREKPRDLR